MSDLKLLAYKCVPELEEIIRPLLSSVSSSKPSAIALTASSAATAAAVSLAPKTESSIVTRSRAKEKGTDVSTSPASSKASAEKDEKKKLNIALLIHGLDSSKQTWSTVQNDLWENMKIPSIAVDVLAFGESPSPIEILKLSQTSSASKAGEADGASSSTASASTDEDGYSKSAASPSKKQANIEENEDFLNSEVDKLFSPTRISNDIYRLLKELQIVDNAAYDTKLLVIGHSMGGRVVMRFAAEFPDVVSRLIIEDMDCIPRSKHGRTSKTRLRELRNFNRRFEGGFEEAFEELGKHGYDRRRLEDYKRTGRIRLVNENDPNGPVWRYVLFYFVYISVKY